MSLTDYITYFGKKPSKKKPTKPKEGEKEPYDLHQSAFEALTTLRSIYAIYQKREDLVQQSELRQRLSKELKDNGEPPALIRAAIEYVTGIISQERFILRIEELFHAKE